MAYDNFWRKTKNANICDGNNSNNALKPVVDFTPMENNKTSCYDGNTPNVEHISNVTDKKVFNFDENIVINLYSETASSFHPDPNVESTHKKQTSEDGDMCAKNSSFASNKAESQHKTNDTNLDNNNLDQQNLSGVAKNKP
ncbi:hypothetical protein COBT_001764, partial [Conglomerata obtusa]